MAGVWRGWTAGFTGLGLRAKEKCKTKKLYVCVCITMQIGFKSVLDYITFVWVKGDDLPEVLETLQVGFLPCICPIKILYFIVFMFY